jgi:hypothetical protein
MVEVGAFYSRGDLFEKRRHLMEAWAAYCAKPATDGKVVSIGAGAPSTSAAFTTSILGDSSPDR